MKKLFMLVLCSFLLLSLHAQNKGNDLLKSVQNKFNSAKDISADVKQVVNGKTNFTGKVYFKKNNMFRVELNNTTLVSNGSTTWNYNKKQNKVVIDQFDASNPSALSINTIINEYPSKSEIKSSVEEGKNIITLTPKKNANLSFDEAKLWINNENLVEKVNLTQSGGRSITVLISNYKLNQNIPDSEFSFNPPQGTKVIDLR